MEKQENTQLIYDVMAIKRFTHISHLHDGHNSFLLKTVLGDQVFS